MKTEQSLFSSNFQPNFSSPVSQLDKPLCLTAHATPPKALAVGRQAKETMHTPTPARGEAVKLPQGFLNHKLISEEKIYKSHAKPENKRAILNLDAIYFLCDTFTKMSPALKVQISHLGYLSSIKLIYNSFQYRLFVKIVRSHALLNHNQRKKIADDKILATEQDFSFALRLMYQRPIKKRLSLLYKGRNRILQHLKKYYSQRSFTRKMLSYDTDLSDSYLKQILLQMLNEGILSVEWQNIKNGRQKLYTLINKEAEDLPVLKRYSQDEMAFNVEVD